MEYTDCAGCLRSTRMAASEVNANGISFIWPRPLLMLAKAYIAGRRSFIRHTIAHHHLRQLGCSTTLIVILPPESRACPQLGRSYPEQTESSRK
jgi:hypothetical protein